MILNSLVKVFDEKKILKFLHTAIYPKFNLYPSITIKDFCDYSLELLNKSFINGKLFISESNSEIEAIISIKTLDWDSNHFGYKCAVIDQYYYNTRHNQQKLCDVFNKMITDVIIFVRRENIRFISISVNSWDTFFSTLLQLQSFKYVLTWIDGVYIPTKKLPILNVDHEIGLIKAEEIPIYQRISENNYFEGGRFYLDQNFNKICVNKMYSELVASSFSNNDIMISYRINGEPVGLFICKKIIKMSNLRVAPLRFFVINNGIRKKYIGLDLFSYTINYLMDKCDIITTGLEVHNLPSLNLHAKLSFKFNYTHNMFHWWAE